MAMQSKKMMTSNLINRWAASLQINSCWWSIRVLFCVSLPLQILRTKNIYALELVVSLIASAMNLTSDFCWFALLDWNRKNLWCGDRWKIRWWSQIFLSWKALFINEKTMDFFFVESDEWRAKTLNECLKHDWSKWSGKCIVKTFEEREEWMFDLQIVCKEWKRGSDGTIKGIKFHNEITESEIIWFMFLIDSHGEKVIRVPPNWISPCHWLPAFTKAKQQ